MRHITTLSITFVIVVFSIQISFSDNYRWTDENGVRHYSEMPPPENVKNVNAENAVNTVPAFYNNTYLR